MVNSFPSFKCSLTISFYFSKKNSPPHPNGDQNVLLNLVPSVFSLFNAAAMASDPSIEAAEGLPERVLLWNETEAEEQQVNQVGASACGATAVLNVLVRKQLQI